MFSIELHDTVTPVIEGLASTVGNFMQDMVEETSDVLTPYVKGRTPIGKHYTFSGQEIMGGQLRDSLHFVIGQYGSYLAGRGYGRYVIGGTRPHVIMPRGDFSDLATRTTHQAKPHLAFFWGRIGKSVTPKMVHHPGTKADDFRQKGVDEAFEENAVQDLAARLMEQWVSGYGA